MRSEHQFCSCKIAAGQRRAVNIAAVAVPAGVEVFLIGIENVFHTGMHLQRHHLAEGNIVSQTQTEVKEVRSLNSNIVFHARTSHMLNKHRAGIGSVQRSRKPLNRAIVQRYVTVEIRCAEHTFLRRCRFAPFHGFLMFALLVGPTRLQLQIRRKGNTTFKRRSVDTRSGSIVALPHHVAEFVLLALLAQVEHVVQFRIETFNKEVRHY